MSALHIHTGHSCRLVSPSYLIDSALRGLATERPELDPSRDLVRLSPFTGLKYRKCTCWQNWWTFHHRQQWQKLVQVSCCADYNTSVSMSGYMLTRALHSQLYSHKFFHSSTHDTSWKWCLRMYVPWYQKPLFSLCSMTLFSLISLHKLLHGVYTLFSSITCGYIQPFVVQLISFSKLIKWSHV